MLVLMINDSSSYTFLLSQNDDKSNREQFILYNVVQRLEWDKMWEIAQKKNCWPELEGLGMLECEEHQLYPEVELDLWVDKDKLQNAYQKYHIIMSEL